MSNFVKYLTTAILLLAVLVFSAGCEEETAESPNRVCIQCGKVLLDLDICSGCAERLMKEADEEIIEESRL